MPHFFSHFPHFFRIFPHFFPIPATAFFPPPCCWVHPSDGVFQENAQPALMTIPQNNPTRGPDRPAPLLMRTPPPPPFPGAFYVQNLFPTIPHGQRMLCDHGCTMVVVGWLTRTGMQCILHRSFVNMQLFLHGMQWIASTFSLDFGAEPWGGGGIASTVPALPFAGTAAQDKVCDSR